MLVILTFSSSKQIAGIVSGTLSKFVPRICDRRSAVLAVAQGVTVIEDSELPAIDFHGHEALVDLIP